MNHIKKLQANVRGLKFELGILNNGIQDLVSYLNSSKFSCGDTLDGYVNIKDVLFRLETCKSEANQARNQYEDIYGKI